MGKNEKKIIQKTTKVMGTAAAVGIAANILRENLTGYVEEEAVVDRSPANEVPVNEVPVNEVPVNEVPVNEVSIEVEPMDGPVHLIQSHVNVPIHEVVSHPEKEHVLEGNEVGFESEQEIVTDIEEGNDMDVLDETVEVIGEDDTFFVVDQSMETLEQLDEKYDVLDEEITDLDDDDWMADNFAPEDEGDELLAQVELKDNDLDLEMEEKADGDMFATSQFSDSDIPDVVHDATDAVDFL